MSPILFWIFTPLMLGLALSVVLNRDPVTSALSLVGSFLCLSVLFVGLDAFFIAAIQVLVYAGAVMVLFLFIIMLLDLRAEARRRLNRLGFVGGTLVSTIFAGSITYVLGDFSQGRDSFTPLRPDRLDDVKAIGISLFSAHNLPLQVVSLIVLTATIGVVALSRRELK